MQKRNNIINFLNNYWNSKNVFFGKKIHNLNPKSKNEWENYLKQNNFFFIKNLKAKGFNAKDHRIWIWYLKNSFWKLYKSEKNAIIFFENNFKIELKFASKYLDTKYGIDFIFNDNNFLIVKNNIIDNNPNFILKNIDLRWFKFNWFNIDNSKIYIFFSNEEKLFLYDKFENSFVLTQKP